MADVQNGQQMRETVYKNTTIPVGGNGGQGKQQGGQQGQSGQYPKDDVLANVDVNVPYDQNVAGDPHDTLWDSMTNALKPDLTPNKDKGNGVLGTVDVNQGGSGSSGGGSKKQS